MLRPLLTASALLLAAPVLSGCLAFTVADAAASAAVGTVKTGAKVTGAVVGAPPTPSPPATSNAASRTPAGRSSTVRSATKAAAEWNPSRKREGTGRASGKGRA